MKHAIVTGWGKCLPPAVVTNDDLATFLDTSDEWITTRTGMKERRISHVTISELGYVAAARALACAGLEKEDLDMVVLASCTFDSGIPNSASFIQRKLGAPNAGCYDINTACTGFMYALSTATGLIQSGVIKNAVLVGAETMSQLMPWHDRSMSVLFGDGAAAWVIEASDNQQGVVAQKLGCIPESRDILQIGYGFTPPGEPRNDLEEWRFQGQDIFKKAVAAMAAASIDVINDAGIDPDEVALCIPHQANKRIIDAVARKAGLPKEKCYVNVHRYGNVSAATVPLATTEALEEHRIKPGDYILMPAFGGGLTWSAHLLKWSNRITPLGTSDVELPPCEDTGLELIDKIMSNRGKSLDALRT